MPPSEGTIVEREPRAADRNQAALQLIETWLREDTPSLGTRLLAHLAGEPEADSWDNLKAELDRDRSSDRKLFR